MTAPIASKRQPQSHEIIAFFSAYPLRALDIISVYYPLTTELLCKYSEILNWGGRDSFDYDDGPEPKTFVFWYPGIIFNRAMKWSDRVRSTVAGALATRGGEYALRDFRWAAFGKEGNPAKDDLSRDFHKTLSLVAKCPLSAKHLRKTHEGLLAYVDWADPPVLLDQMSWDDVVAGIVSDSFPEVILHPELWAHTLSNYFTDAVVPTLLKILYWNYLHGGFHKVLKPW